MHSLSCISWKKGEEGEDENKLLAILILRDLEEEVVKDRLIGYPFFLRVCGKRGGRPTLMNKEIK